MMAIKNHMMIAIFLACTSVSWAGDASPSVGHPDSLSWQNLFEQDFSNAIFIELDRKFSGNICDNEHWFIRDGILRADDDQMILTKKQYGNCIIDLEFKNCDEANSGVFIYCSDIKDWVLSKLEVQILDDYAEKYAETPDTGLCGAIYSRLPPCEQAVKKAGEWNRMTIWCLGPKVSVMLNGKLVAQIDMTEWTSGEKTPDGRDIPSFFNRPLAELPLHGHIGLQGKHFGGAVHFRNVKIKDLSAQKLHVGNRFPVHTK